jgi:DNA (cytosine-5)-methyltransferase 1
MLTVGSLFAGIGGIELGLERTGGFQTLWQVEQDEFARRVLAKHWPDVPRWDDVRTFPPDEGWRCDLVCGGFPCKQTSTAAAVHGRRHGLSGADSGLWHEQRRVIGRLRGEPLTETLGSRLSPEFCEWMMGFPVGWTDVDASSASATR